MIEQMMRSTAFGKITAVYGHIDENGLFVRKWPARKIPITDKMVKNSLAANLTGRILHLAKSLSFTDTSMKMGMLSVNSLLEKWRLRTKRSKKAVCP